MNSQRRAWSALAGAMAMAGAVLFQGCGSAGDSSPTRSGPLVADEFAARAVQHPGDTLTRGLGFAASVEYDDGADRVSVFAVVRALGSAASGLEVADLNRHNFTITLFPANAPRLVEPTQVTVSRMVSGARVVGLVLDTSGSMGSLVGPAGPTRLTVAKEAASLFIDGMSGADLVALAEFNSEARTVLGLTEDTEALKAAVNALVAEGATNLGAALTEGVRAVGTRPGRRALILLTDGVDTVDSVIGGPAQWGSDSDSLRAKALSLAVELDLPVYTVGFGLGGDPDAVLPPFTDIDPGDGTAVAIADLKHIAAETGGKAFFADSAEALRRAFAETIPGEIDRLTPLETYRLEFANPVKVTPLARTKTAVVPLRVGVGYLAGTGLYRAKFNGSYRVK